jgi:phage terminase large subunit
MQTSMSSLRALPPRQALALALAEKMRRTKLKEERQRLSELAAASRSEDEAGPTPRDIPSLVLDKNHPISDLYFKKARWKIYWGGRGSVKSWGSAEAAIRLAAALPLRFVFSREHLVSIKHSSHKLLKDTIYRLGLEAWFDVTDSSIKSRVGAEFIFMGLHQNENGIRSTEGVDVWVVEEAQAVSSASWQSLEPTLRKSGSEFWVLYNLNEESDATHQLMLALKADPNSGAIIHNINYDSNPFFPEELRLQMERHKKQDYELYEHIWLGKPKRRSNAIVLNGKYVVESFADDLWRKADRLLFGGDFGYAEDPSTLVRFFMLQVDTVGGAPLYDLYIEYEAYAQHVETSDMDAFYGGGPSRITPNREFPGVPLAKSWPIKADSSRPETISAIRGHGFAISAAEKWPGSVEDGIAALRAFRRIVIHPRCVRAAEEAYMWRFKVDKHQVDEHGQPMVLPKLVDGNDHCWDAVRYGLDGYIQRSGAMGSWARIGRADRAIGGNSGVVAHPALADLVKIGRAGGG